MKYNVIFTDDTSKLDWFATNIISVDLDNLPNNSYKLSYRLNNEFLTHKFVYAFVNTQKQNINQLGAASYNYNYYFNPTVAFFKKAKTEMNEAIDELNRINLSTHFFTISDELKLNVDSLDPEYNKINELHFIFEKELVALPLYFPEKERMWYLLEKVNNLVHFIERKCQVQTNIPKSFMISCRTHGGLDYFYTLRPEDYKSFQMPSPGDLVADYSTVGKDLFAAAITNDLELVKNNELKQQEYITGYAFMPFNYGQNQLTEVYSYYKWLHKNDIRNYVNWSEPKYIAGRHVLGQLDMQYNNIEHIQMVLNKTPYLASVYITDNNDNILKEYEL